MTTTEPNWTPKLQKWQLEVLNFVKSGKRLCFTPARRCGRTQIMEELKHEYPDIKIVEFSKVTKDE